MTETIKVTVQGVLVPRPMIQAWGDVQEVEIEQRPDAIIIKPKGRPATELRERIIAEMKAAGLVEDLPWVGQGKPLSEIIIEEREDRA
jgi:hypothetical protein